jgi:hypothetical protein
MSALYRILYCIYTICWTCQLCVEYYIYTSCWTCQLNIENVVDRLLDMSTNLCIRLVQNVNSAEGLSKVSTLAKGYSNCQLWRRVIQNVNSAEGLLKNVNSAEGLFKMSTLQKVCSKMSNLRRVTQNVNSGYKGCSKCQFCKENYPYRLLSCRLNIELYFLRLFNMSTLNRKLFIAAGQRVN